MKKVAFFVEGQTEAIFIKELLFAYLGYQNLRIEHSQIYGDCFYDIGAFGVPPDDAEIEVFIMDCQGDEKVLSAILERLDNLKAEGYTSIIGVRDLYPETPENAAEIEREISGEIENKLEDGLFPVRIFLAIMEIEAWFLSDARLFHKLSDDLSDEMIANALNVDEDLANIEGVRHPSRLISRVLQSVGLDYKKREKDAQKIVSALNMDDVFYDGRQRSASLRSFLEYFERAFG